MSFAPWQIRINKLNMDCQTNWDNNLNMLDKNNSIFFQKVKDITYVLRNFTISLILTISKFNTVKLMRRMWFFRHLQNKLCLMKNSTCSINQLSSIHYDDKSSFQSYLIVYLDGKQDSNTRTFNFRHDWLTHRIKN